MQATYDNWRPPWLSGSYHSRSIGLVERGDAADAKSMEAFLNAVWGGCHHTGPAPGDDLGEPPPPPPMSANDFFNQGLAPGPKPDADGGSRGAHVGPHISKEIERLHVVDRAGVERRARLHDVVEAVWFGLQHGVFAGRAVLSAAESNALLQWLEALLALLPTAAATVGSRSQHRRFVLRHCRAPTSYQVL